MEQTVKIHAFLAQMGIASRRKCEELVSAGKVTVNGKSAVIGQRINPLNDRVTVSGKPISPTQKLVYYKLYKPRGVVSTTQDELARKNVVDLLPPSKQRLYPVGRLDLDSEGLILLTNDGELANVLTHPKFEIEKTYHVLLKGIPSTPALNHLKRGVKLKDGFIKPVKIEILKHENYNTWLSITIKEGKKHQVRRMVMRIGYEILSLVRVQMGPLTLGTLKPGQFLKLTTVELAQLTVLKQAVYK